MYQLGRYEESKHFLTRSIEANDDNPRAYAALGDLYFARKEYAESIANYRMATVQQEDLPGAYLGLGQAMEAIGHLTEAEEALQRALYHDPDNPVVMYRLGQVHGLMHNTARAQSYYEMALENSAGDYELQNTIRSAIKSLSEMEND
jgi:tetratricopeptide (TPR) repeat protein